MAANGGLRRAVGLSPGRTPDEDRMRAVFNRIRCADLFVRCGRALAFWHGTGLRPTDPDSQGLGRVDLRGTSG